MPHLGGEPAPSGWGSEDQYRHPPRDRDGWLGLALLLVLALMLLRLVGGSIAPWHTVRIPLAIVATVLVVMRLAGSRRTPPPRAEDRSEPLVLERVEDPLERLRERAQAQGGGALLGSCRGDWVWADPEHAVLGLGPPRSGKSSSLVIPSLLACPGAAVSTSTKPDVMLATLAARARLGDVWFFDPAGQQRDLPAGVRRLCWSPVAGATSWDDALLMARAMVHAAPAGRGTTAEQHWSERAGALLAPLLYAASVRELPIANVLRWVLRSDLDEPARILEDAHAEMAGDVLVGIVKTEARERSSIFSATAGVLAAYNADAARAAAAHPNFDPSEFVTGRGTVYISAAAHRQAACAPLVVGLLEQLRHATYQRATVAGSDAAQSPVFFCLDELANIAPIPDLPALVSEAGGQCLHVLACLQDLSQARQRWGDHAADGLVTLFQVKLVFPGIADPRTLEAISLIAGEHDRQLVSVTLGVTRSGGMLRGESSSSESVTYHTQRQRTLAPGDVANLPAGRGLLIRGARCGLIRLAPHYRTRPFDQITRASRRELTADRDRPTVQLSPTPSARGLAAGRTR